MSEHDDSYEPHHESSPTDHVLSELQLYGYRPFADEPDGRPLPEGNHVAGAIADVFDALNSPRPYKQPWPLEDTVAYLRDQAGRHFDPTLVALFLDHLPQAQEVMRQWQDR